MFEEADVIYTYSRRQAIEDGVLVDVSETAKECGFKYPVAVTTRVWAEVVTPEENARALGQSEAGRLWDVIWMLYVAIRRSGATEVIHYTILVSDGKAPRKVPLKAVCGPGDDAHPVITIMAPDED